MKMFNWSEEKNKTLKKERGLSFEEIVFAILNDQLLDILEHPNKKLYAGQKLYVVALNDYAYIVPFVEREDEQIQSRKSGHQQYRPSLPHRSEQIQPSNYPKHDQRRQGDRPGHYHDNHTEESRRGHEWSTTL